MHIHFVCTGNGYRSRLAEAYLKSKLTKGKIKVSSSGIAANESRFDNGPICWYAMKLIQKVKVIPYMSWKGNQTTKEILKNVDLLICMNNTHLEFCKKNFGFIKQYDVWDIPDLDEMKGYIPSDIPGIETDINHIKLTEKAFEVIMKKVDKLLAKILNKI